MDDPFSIFESKKCSAKIIIKETQELLEKYQEKVKCIKNPQELPNTPQKDCSYLQFLIHKVDPQKSLLKVFSHEGEGWKEQIFKILDPFFIKTTRRLIHV